MTFQKGRSRPRRDVGKPASKTDLHGGGVKTSNSTKSPSRATIPDTAHAICVGRQMLGWLISRGDRFEAITPDHKSLGYFNTGSGAAEALAFYAEGSR